MIEGMSLLVDEVEDSVFGEEVCAAQKRRSEIVSRDAV